MNSPITDLAEYRLQRALRSSSSRAAQRRRFLWQGVGATQSQIVEFPAVTRREQGMAGEEARSIPR